MAGGALDDVVVLELATGVAGPYCGKLLADLGAQVVKVEPASGDPTRAEYPLVDGESAFFNWLNANKLGAQLEADDRRVIALAQKADIIIHDAVGPQADKLDLELRKANIGATIVSLSPYGRTGERAGCASSALTQYATSGFGYIAGDPEREPLSLPGHQVDFHAGLHGAIAALSGLWHSRETGEGQVVEISHQEATLVDHAWLTIVWTHQGQVQRREGNLFVKCADGYVYLFNLIPYPNLFILMERYDLLDDEELLHPLTWTARFDEIRQALGEWAATRTKQEIYHAAQELRVPISPVNTIEDVAKSPQLAAREWFTNVRVGGKEFVAPGFPFRMAETPCETRLRAPRIGEHTQAVFGPRFDWANRFERQPRHAAIPGASSAGMPGGPLAGLRVIELTAHWAGPIGGRHLADLGAEVIKVELATKPASRALVYVADDFWPEHYHRSGYFNKLNRNKKAICLDLSKPEGHAAFLELVADADVVLENNSVRVMGQLGLDYDTLKKTNPGLVMCSISGMGAAGPERHYSAFGSNVETLSGVASMLGYKPGEAFGTGSFYADPVAGNHAVVAILAALHRRRSSGEGQWIDIALTEAVGPFFAQQFLEYTVEGRVPEPMGNRHRVHAPQGVYESFGTDCWLALTVRDERDWEALCDVIGREDLRDDPGLRTAEGRRARHDEIDEAIRTWTRERDHLAASEALQNAGVPAMPVMPNWELFSDNHLNSRDFFVRISHPKSGTHWFPGFAWKFTRTPVTIERPAPLFAEHNQDVFAGVMGMEPEEIERLYASGATQDEPVYENGPRL